MANKNENLKKSLIEDYPNKFSTNSNIQKTEHMQYNTLREGVWDSLKRELMRIYNKAQYVIIPRCSAGDNKDLRNWDLWGPLIFTMLLSYFISESKTNDDMSITFCLVFVIMWLGGSIVTVNSILLGSKITLFQALCVLGYCLFPVVLAAALMDYLRVLLTMPIKLGMGAGAFFWSSTSSISFMGDIVGQDKKGLAVFPIYLFYFAFCCFLLL